MPNLVRARPSCADKKAEEDLAREALSRRKTLPDMPPRPHSQLQQPVGPVGKPQKEPLALEGKISQAKNKKGHCSMPAPGARPGTAAECRQAAWHQTRAMLPFDRVWRRKFSSRRRAGSGCRTAEPISKSVRLPVEALRRGDEKLRVEKSLEAAPRLAPALPPTPPNPGSQPVQGAEVEMPNSRTTQCAERPMSEPGATPLIAPLSGFIQRDLSNPCLSPSSPIPASSSTCWRPAHRSC